MRFLGPIKNDGPAGMRERGFDDGYAGRGPRPPVDPRLAAAYQAGHRKGATERGKDSE